LAREIWGGGKWGIATGEIGIYRGKIEIYLRRNKGMLAEKLQNTIREIWTYQ
jgi:hypothetical protein